MTVRILYKDNTYDMVSAFALQRLIESERVKMFYRYSEKRWVSIGADSVRSRGHAARYAGPERRMADVMMTQA